MQHATKYILQFMVTLKGSSSQAQAITEYLSTDKLVNQQIDQIETVGLTTELIHTNKTEKLLRFR